MLQAATSIAVTTIITTTITAIVPAAAITIIGQETGHQEGQTFKSGDDDFIPVGLLQGHGVGTVISGFTHKNGAIGSKTGVFGAIGTESGQKTVFRIRRGCSCDHNFSVRLHGHALTLNIKIICRCKQEPMTTTWSDLKKDYLAKRGVKA